MTRLLLRVGVKVRPEAQIDHTKVKIQVFFYDMVNNDQVAADRRRSELRMGHARPRLGGDRDRSA